MNVPVLILDFGSQYTQLIARRVRAAGVYCEIVPGTWSVARVLDARPEALILSGGPKSVYDADAVAVDPEVLDLPLPILAICYGQQLLAHHLGGRVVPSAQREYGRATVTWLPAASRLREGIPDAHSVWMSHGDRIEALPSGFIAIAATEATPYAAIAHAERPVVGVQFHPEVLHTTHGDRLLGNFLFGVAHLEVSWQPLACLARCEQELGRALSQPGRILCALSGGVDSSVLAVLLSRVARDRTVCVSVDNGLLRSGDLRFIRQVLVQKLGIDVRIEDAGDRFLARLQGITDPERKRRIVGETFIEVFVAATRQLSDVRYLAQGTLYPDVIESQASVGPSSVIKSHHNVGGLPSSLPFSLVEPFRFLFKDEVRQMGLALGLPAEVIERHPFPGPGLSVRVVGEVTPARVATLRAADDIVMEEVGRHAALKDCWQCFPILLPVRSVGVMGDKRTYDEVVALRAVHSVDGMTADWARLPADLLAHLSSRIMNEVSGINRVLFDISSKPPATIEWE